jgi:hypothetical protein
MPKTGEFPLHPHLAHLQLLQKETFFIHFLAIPNCYMAHYHSFEINATINITRALLGLKFMKIYFRTAYSRQFNSSRRKVPIRIFIKLLKLREKRLDAKLFSDFLQICF